MGKKVISPASLKISKNHGKKMKKQLPNSLIQVLRPKVYITDSSSFKNLVQKLTGSGSSSSSSATPPPITHPETVVDNHGGDPEISSSCMETISNASLDSFDPCSYYPVTSYCSSSSSTEKDFFNKYDAVYNPIFLEETTTSVECLLMDHQQQAVGLLEYQDLESWLLDMEPPAAAAAAYSSCNIVSGHPITQEVSIYDYEISGLI